MKNLTWVALVLILAACKKTDQQAAPNQQAEKVTCDFGITNFNLTKRAAVADEFTTGTRSTATTTTVPANVGVIYLDLDGETVTGTSWNLTIPTINCTPANLTAAQVTEIVNRVSNDYSPFNALVTTDINVFNAANPARRQKVVITETWEWYGQAGGASLMNSFTQATNNPAFVFSSLLNYNTKNIAEACSHEVGHTLGLRHQSVYNSSCVKVAEYNPGQGSGEIGSAPIMGTAYYQNLSLWHKGPNSVSCNTIQDDVAKIAAFLGYKSDDYPNTSTNAPTLVNSLSGIINNSNDVDGFWISLPVTKTVSLVPYNVGPNNSGADEDLILKIYDKTGNLLSSNNDPSLLNTSVTLAPATYFITVSTIENQFTLRYGMLGMYTITLN